MRRTRVERERELLEHLRYCGRHQLRHGVVPTVRYAAKELGLAENMVQRDRGILQADGLLRKAIGRDEDRLTAAGWAVLRRKFLGEFGRIDDSGRRQPSPDELLARIGLRRVPLVSAKIGAGLSRQVYDAVDAAHADEFVLMDDDHAGGRTRVFAVEVVGDSMVDAHILPGDTALFRPADTAQTGDIVAAVLEDGTVTIKRFERAGDEVRLWAANPTWPDPIVVPAGAGDFSDVETIRILGVYEGLRRGVGARTVPASAWAPVDVV